VEGGGPASLPDYSTGYTPGYYAAMIRSTQTFKPFPGSGGLKLTAVFVREVPGPVASFSRINSVGINIGVAELSLSRSPILLIANEGTGPLINARITGVEITGARLKIANNEAGEINTGGFFEFYQPPAFRPLTPEETATPDPYNIRYTQYGGIMVASKPQLTAPGNAITASNPINIGTLNPGQDREFNNLQYAWVKANVGFGAPIGGVSFSFLQYRVTIWITADNFETAPVSFWTN